MPEIISYKGKVITSLWDQDGQSRAWSMDFWRLFSSPRAGPARFLSAVAGLGSSMLTVRGRAILSFSSDSSFQVSKAAMACVISGKVCVQQVMCSELWLPWKTFQVLFPVGQHPGDVFISQSIMEQDPWGTLDTFCLVVFKGLYSLFKGASATPRNFVKHWVPKPHCQRCHVY